MERPRDTTADAHRRLIDALRAMPPAERLRLAAAMSAEVRSLAVAGIHHRHPNASQRDVEAELSEIFVGRELAKARRAD